MNTRLIAESSILASLSLVILLIASLSPVNKLFIASASALVLEVSIKRNHMKSSLFVFFPTAILSFFFLPYKMFAILYFFLFGGYSIIRNYITINNKVLKKTFLIIYFDTVFWILFVLANQLFENVFEKLINGPFWQNLLLFFVLQLAVLLYDYALDIASKLLINKLKKLGI